MLADSSVVVLALPDVLSSFDVSIERVSWVITAFNLVLALAAVPAAYLAVRASANGVVAAGLAVFALASATCAATGSFDVLLAARCVQAASGALVVCAALRLLPALLGSPARGVAAWAAAAAAGAARRPGRGRRADAGVHLAGRVRRPGAAGARAAAPAPGAARPVAVPAEAVEGRVRPRASPNIALALVSAALTAALFLLVLELVRGWGLDPLAAAVVLTVIPAAATVTAALARSARDAAGLPAAGVILIAGGLAALALVPSASIGWTLLPQALIGAGLALTLPGLTREALAGVGSLSIHGGWTIGARHAGVVVGLLILTPIFTADLVTQQAAAERSGAALVLNSRLSLQAKLRLGDAIDQSLRTTQNRLPDLGPAFARSTRRPRTGRSTTTCAPR